MTGRRLHAITFAMMLSLFLASIETTVVATAMPTIVAQLGGLEIYAWVFSAYMLTSTTMVPVFGKLSDIYGRQHIYLAAMAIFLIGSILAAQAHDMVQLVLYRALQGLGAGGMLPLAFIIIGDIFTFEQRAKMQGVFAGVWGISSIIGPLVGGFLVDQASWQWVFYINLPIGLFAALLMILAWQDVTPRSSGHIDYIGAALMSGGIVLLMLSLFELRSSAEADWMHFIVLLVIALTMFVTLFFVERSAQNPILPLALFSDRLFSTAMGHGFLSGFALFGSTSFIPLFVQAVLGTTATAAGATLTPQILGWVSASVIGSRLLLRFNYRSLALVGMSLLVVSFILLTQVGATTPQWLLVIAVALSGVGMGLSVPPFLIAVQTTVPRQSLGTATATLQFSRNIGGTVGVSVMGVMLAAQLATRLTTAGLDPHQVSIGELLESSTQVSVATLGLVRGAVASAVQNVFVIALFSALLGWIATWFAPRGRIGARMPVKSTADEAIVGKRTLPVD